MKVRRQLGGEGRRVPREDDSIGTLRPGEDVRIRRTERKVSPVANPSRINSRRSAAVVATDRMPERFSAKILVQHEGDGHRSGFRLRFPCQSLRD